MVAISVRGVSSAAGIPDVSHASQAAHARMLREAPVDGPGEVIEAAAALELLDNGQVINCTLTGDRLLVGAPPPLDAAEVLAIDAPAGQVSLFPERLIRSMMPFQKVQLDFTDTSGTYLLKGVISRIVTDAAPYIVVDVRETRLRQLRRFVRVPVLIGPERFEVQAAPDGFGEWRATSGEIVDISVGGVGLLVGEPLETGARVRLEFELPGRFGNMVVFGRIVPPPGPAEARTQPRREQRLAIRRGVMFEPLSAGELRRLQRALYHRQVQLRRLSDAPLVRPEAAVPSTAAGRKRWWRRLWGR
ncbi:MAG: PilZ domain-containing protein [Chloroflexi bacterium]|nr:PilZ domain-containing protein [Chloroflexota bacterium]